MKLSNPPFGALGSPRGRPFTGGLARTFSPNSLSGLALWLDTNDATSLAINASGSVPVGESGMQFVRFWRDLSGNGRHLTQSDAVSAPVPIYNSLSTRINGLRAVRFDGADDELTGPLNVLPLGPSSTFTGFAVLSVNAAGVTQYALGQYGASGWDLIFNQGSGTSDFAIRGGGGLTRRQGSGAAAGYVGTNLWTFGRTSANGFRDVVLRKNGVGTVTAVSDTLPANADLTPVVPLTLGTRAPNAGNWLNALVGEVILYARELSSAEIQTVENHLRRKWGL